ncbi:alpha/beta hydrolase-fold protein [uncultured Croceitalea sp.]|uniref:alpha/beta hydrolase n=1 Tax=uncultured Croceitalea sp. TaxID=1798908 RepID=UPI003306891A
MKKLIVVLLLGAFSIGNAQIASPKVFEFPFKVQVYDLPTSENGINYRIYVRPPLIAPEEGEKASSFYFLDPLRLFVPSSAMTSNFEYFNYHPAAYFIGVGYQNETDGIPKELNRIRDYTPTNFVPTENHFLANKATEYKDSGECDAFLEVLKGELIPFIEDNFEVSEDRVLIGKSMSGLAAVHSFLTRPNLFNRYIIISPSLWWDDWFKKRHERYVMRQLQNINLENYDKEVRVYFAVGEDEERFGLITDLYVLVNAINAMGSKNLKIHLDVLEGEQHEGVFPGAFMKGIVGIYTNEKNRRSSSSKVKW